MQTPHERIRVCGGLDARVKGEEPLRPICGAREACQNPAHNSPCLPYFPSFIRRLRAALLSELSVTFSFSQLRGQVPRVTPRPVYYDFRFYEIELWTGNPEAVHRVEEHLCENE